MRSICKAFFIISVHWGKAQPVAGGAIPALLVLGSIKKQAEQGMGNKSVSSILHGVCNSSCLQHPALFEFLS